MIHQLHIPKTGGTALYWGLHPHVTKHHHDYVLADIPDPVITILRDPVDRFVSCFDWSRYHMDTMPLWSSVDEAAGVISGMDDHEMPLRYLFWPMRHWLGDDIGRCAYVGRLETLDADFGAIKRLFGLPAGLRLPVPGDRRRNESRQGVPGPRPPGWSGKSRISPEAAAKVRERYAEDYALLTGVTPR